MVRVVKFHEFGDASVLHLEESAVRTPSENEVRIRVKALGLNRAEALMRRGTYIETPDLPSGLGLEAAGEIESVGNGVRGLTPGDAVSVIPTRSMIQWPAYGELAVFPAGHVVKHPAHLSWTQAAATWMAFITAYGALVELANVQCGEYVLITAASSSVGLAAIQIARAKGAYPIAITRTRDKAPALKQAGADAVIVLSENDLAEQVQSLSNGNGARVVFDAVGGPLFGPLTDAMSRDGLLIEYGGLSSEPTPFPLFTVLGKRLTLRGYLMHEVTENPKRLTRAKAWILDGLNTGRLSPIIDRVFPFEQIVEAHRYLESNAQFGKVVVTI